MADERCKGCGRCKSRCDYCGRFMSHWWFRTNDEPDGWEDYWLCTRQDDHIRDHPRDFGRESPNTRQENDRG